MMLWVIIALIAAASLIALAWPFFNAPAAHASFDETDYLAAQLDDVEREFERGVLSEEDAESARLEAKRRLLAAGRADKKSAPVNQSAVAANLRQGAIMGVGAVPLAAIALYLGIGGGDDLSTSPLAPRQSLTSEQTQAAPVGELVAGLEQRLADNPNDIDGWVMLAETYAQFSEYKKSASAFAKAIDLDPNSAFLHAAFGEALVLDAQGDVTADAEAAFNRALKADAREPRARYYLAVGVYQHGEKPEAFKMLAALVNDAPDDAPWLALAHNELVTIAMALGQTLEEAGLSEAAQARLERAMTADLARASAGDDAPREEISRLETLVASGDAAYTDWLRLAELHAVSSDRAKAIGIIARARARYATAPFVLKEIDAAEARLLSAEGSAPRRGPTGADIAAAQSMSEDDRQAMVKGMVEGLAVRLEAAPNDPDGWMMLARSYGVLGDLDKSAGAYERAAALRPDDLSIEVAYARALVARSGGDVAVIDAKTEGVLRKILALDADQPLALYFLGLHAQQNDDLAAAKSHWERLAAQLPNGSIEANEIAALLRSLDR